MRVRTAIAGTTLALLTLLWTAPAALADDGDGASSTATASPSGQSGNSGEGNSGEHSEGGGNRQSGAGTGGSRRLSDTPTPPSEPTTTDVPRPTTTDVPRPTTTDVPRPTTTVVPRPTTTGHEVPPAPASQPAQVVVPDPKPSLSVAPQTVRPGDTVTVSASCQPGTQVSLTAAGVNLQGNSARIDQDTEVGPHQVTLVCANGPNRVSASASFTVTRDPNGLPLKASLAVSPKTVRPGDNVESGAVCQGGHQQSLTSDVVRFNGTGGRVGPTAGDGDHQVTLVCAAGDKTDTATDHFRVDRSGGPSGPGNGQATLWLSPKVVRQGDVIYANGGCGGGQERALYGDDVSFHGRQGWVSDNAREGDHTVTRICVIGPPSGPGPRPHYLERVEATDHFRVIRGDGPVTGPGPRDFWLSARSGSRGDEVDVSVRCRDDRAQLDSDVLDDITLRRDGSRLTGTTHVRYHADEGWSRVTVSCDGHSQSIGFWVLRDRGDHDEYLDLDPAFGHQGDVIDVHVGCDSWVGSLDSDVLDDIDLDHNGRPWRYGGTTHVHGNAEPGEHTIRVRCGGDTLEASFFVQGSGDQDGDTSDVGGSPGGGNDVTVYPKGAPETGGGPSGQSAAGLFALGLTGLTGLTGAGLSGVAGRNRRKEQR